MPVVGEGMKYDPDIHHRRSIRLREYDYSSTGAYFVTICTQGRECLFGQVLDGTLHLNDAGRMVSEWWLKLPGKFPGVALNEYMIMPNHFHGIVMINDAETVGADPRVRPDVADPCVCTYYGKDVGADPCVCPDYDMPENAGGHVGPEKMGGHTGPPLQRVVQWFKTMTTNAYICGVNEHGWPPFAGRLWQRNYYERVIRDERELAAARKYIVENPLKWHLDREHPQNATHPTNTES